VVVEKEEFERKNQYLGERVWEGFKVDMTEEHLQVEEFCRTAVINPQALVVQEDELRHCLRFLVDVLG
jgi:hypothetical protein